MITRNKKKKYSFDTLLSNKPWNYEFVLIYNILEVKAFGLSFYCWPSNARVYKGFQKFNKDFNNTVFPT